MNAVLLNLLLDLPLLAAVVVYHFPWFFHAYREEYGERAPLAPA